MNQKSYESNTIELHNWFNNFSRTTSYQTKFRDYTILNSRPTGCNRFIKNINSDKDDNKKNLYPKVRRGQFHYAITGLMKIPH